MLLASCAPPVVKLDATFNPEEAKFIKATGKSSITGQLFLRRNDGIVVYGAGSQIFLIPSTTYSRERMSKIYGTAKLRLAYFIPTFEGDDPLYREYTKATKADGQGRFEFSNLSAGAYYIVGPVTWCAPSRYGCDTQGGSLMENVVLGRDEKKEIVMNGM